MSVLCSTNSKKRKLRCDVEEDLNSKGALTDEVKAFLAFKYSSQENKKKRSLAEKKTLADLRSVEAEKTLSSRTIWREKDCDYQTRVELKGTTYHIYSTSLASAKEADDHANAAADSLNSFATQRKNKAAKLDRLSSKRTKDLSLFSGTVDMERHVALKIVEAWKEMTNNTAFVLNDSTRADIILGFGNDTFLPVQLKTTNAPIRCSYRFAHVCGYSGMPVVCWKCDVNKAWIFDGTALDDRAMKSLQISPARQRNREMALASDVDMTALVSFLRTSSQWNTTTEDAARSDFASESNATEYKGITAYCALFPDKQFAWPTEQNSHIDLLEECAVRLQFKTVRRIKGVSGFKCNLTTRGGKDENGKQIYVPYQKGSFDALVAVYFDPKGTPHFWKIPAQILEQRGILGVKTCISVFAPKNAAFETRSVDEQKCKNLWTREYFISAR